MTDPALQVESEKETLREALRKIAEVASAGMAGPASMDESRWGAVHLVATRALSESSASEPVAVAGRVANGGNSPAESSASEPDRERDLQAFVRSEEPPWDTTLCPACHHRDHDPGSCHEGCDRCELHTDEALDWVLRHEPGLLAERGYVASRSEPDPGLREAAREVWDSVPASYDEDDPMVQRHARALNALGAALSRSEPDTGMEEAWKRAEAALPEGWELELKVGGSRPDLYFATAAYAYSLRHYRENVGPSRCVPFEMAHAESPTAALDTLNDALTARLSESPPLSRSKEADTT